MTNKKFLERASKLQAEKIELKLVGIYDSSIQVTGEKFHELEREGGLLLHISKKHDKKYNYWEYTAMAPDGVKIMALEYVKDMVKK